MRDGVKWHYLALVKNFENLAQFEDADDCLYQYRRLRQRNADLGLNKIIDFLAWQSCGYGVRPSYTLAWSFGLIFLFGIIFWVGNGIRKSSTSYHEIYAPGYERKRQYRKDLSNLWNEIRKSSHRNEQALSFISTLYFSALVFFHTWPHHKMRPAGRWKYAVLFEDILGWLFLALFLVTLANVMIR